MGGEEGMRVYPSLLHTGDQLPLSLGGKDKNNENNFSNFIKKIQKSTNEIFKWKIISYQFSVSFRKSMLKLLQASYDLHRIATTKASEMLKFSKLCH